MTVVLVLGMHRSGTSCLAGALQAAGLDAGEVVESAPFNPKGNRENLRIRALNDAVLEASGGSWRRQPRHLQWQPEHEEERGRIIAEFNARTDHWMFKDPRTVLTLDFWRAADVGVEFVGTFRHPSAVVASLQQRAIDSSDPQLDIATDEALHLWLQHNRVIADLRRRGAFPLICFDSPPSEYLDSLKDAIGWLQTKIDARPPLQPEEAARIFDLRLIRQSPPSARASSEAAFRSELMEAAEALYSELSKMTGRDGPNPTS